MDRPFTLPPPLSVAFLGNACVDVVIEVPHYPKEDTKVRALRSPVRYLGGNACNSCVAFSALARLLPDATEGAPLPPQCSLIAAVGSDDDPDSKWLLSQLDGAGVNNRPCVPVSTSDCTSMPVSYIMINAENGSRTILHHRGLPELDAAQLCTACCRLSIGDSLHWSASLTSGVDSISDLVLQHALTASGLTWLHVESRSPPVCARVMHACAQLGPTRPVVSLELEQYRGASGSDPDAEMRALVPLADVVIVGKEYWTALGIASWKDALARVVPFAQTHALIVLPNGSEGLNASIPSVLVTPDGTVLRETRSFPAHAPCISGGRVVDSRAAGDTLVAALVFAAVNNERLVRAIRAQTVQHQPIDSATTVSPTGTALLNHEMWFRDALDVLTFATVVAGEKVGQAGLDFGANGYIRDAVADITAARGSV